MTLSADHQPFPLFIPRPACVDNEACYRCEPVPCCVGLDAKSPELHSQTLRERADLRSGGGELLCAVLKVPGQCVLSSRWCHPTSDTDLEVAIVIRRRLKALAAHITVLKTATVSPANLSLQGSREKVEDRADWNARLSSRRNEHASGEGHHAESSPSSVRLLLLLGLERKKGVLDEIWMRAVVEYTISTILLAVSSSKESSLHFQALVRS